MCSRYQQRWFLSTANFRLGAPCGTGKPGLAKAERAVPIQIHPKNTLDGPCPAHPVRAYGAGGQAGVSPPTRDSGCRYAVDREQALAHHADPLGAAGDGGVVGDQDQSEAAFPPELLQQVDDLVAGVLVEVAGGLVGQ